ncbi:MAG: hypothetical protein MK098_05150 [Marinovum sp.]|nr:hypothetical protein [Marinovum sp.]
MFQNWGFLISEMVVLITLAALLGLFVGWLIWGRGAANGAGSLEADRFKRELDNCQAAHADKDAQIATLQADLDAARRAAKVVPREAVAAPAKAPEAVDYDGDGVVEGTDEGVKPQSLDAARDGTPDDLKQIKGIGPKLEQLCFTLGFYHFDQIAAWSADEVAWVDANLEGFKGRVTRDDWVAQAKVLSEGGTTEFSERVKGGDVYE